MQRQSVTVSIATTLTQFSELIYRVTVLALTVSEPSMVPFPFSDPPDGTLTEAALSVVPNTLTPGILNVNGNATLSRYLYLHYDFKNPPQKGATYTVMTFGSLSGKFTNVSPGTAKYTNNSVVVKFG